MATTEGGSYLAMRDWLDPLADVDFAQYLRLILPLPMWDACGIEMARVARERQNHLVKPPGAEDSRFFDRLPEFLDRGTIQFGQLLAPHELAEIRAYFERQSGYDGHHIRGSDKILRPYAELAAKHRYCCHSIDTVLRAPHLLKLANHPALIDLVEKALGCVPTLYSVSAWWSFPGFAEPWPVYSQYFHRDRDCYRFFTLFVYLTDVDEGAGPHQILPRSQLAAGTRDLIAAAQRAGRLAPDAPEEPFFAYQPVAPGQIENLFGDALATIVGPAGSAMLCDTRAFHRGLMPRDKSRLIFWARYGVSRNTNSADLEMGPLRRETLDLDLEEGPRTAYINRLLVRW
jgi:hypothetical protein